ncbi:hypothetical protein GCM10009593_29330 [Microlunatus antarcticus]
MTSVGVPAVLTSPRLETADTWTAVEAAFEVTVAPAGLRPVTVAVLLTAPESTSAWVIVYAVLVVQVVAAPGASVVATQVVAPTFGSATASAVIVSAPVFRAANV